MSSKIASLPQAVFFNGVCEYLTASDLINLKNASQSEPNIKELRKKFFQEHFGALSSGESLNKFPALYQAIINIKKAINFDDMTIQAARFFGNNFGSDEIREKMGAGWMLEFKDSTPVMQKFDSKLLTKGLSFKERIKAKYHFFRGDHHRQIYQKIEAIINDLNKVTNEFNGAAIDNFTVLKERLKRIQKLQICHLYLGLAYECSKITHRKFLNSLSCFEKLIFKIVAFFSKLKFKMPKLTPLSTSFNDYNSRGVKLGSAKFSFAGEEHHVEIIGKFVKNSWDFPNRPSLILQEKDKWLGTVVLERYWKYSDFTIFPVYDENDKLADMPKNLNRDLRLLEIREIRNRTDYGQDPISGDLPVKRLLAKIAMEVFSREPEGTLKVTCTSLDTAHIFQTAGFSNDLSNDLRQKVDTARREGKLYPPEKTECTHTMELRKSDQPVDGTKFIKSKVKDTPAQAARVDFQLGKPPITWEEELHQRKLLDGTEPVLAPFAKKRVFKLKLTI